MDNFSCQNPACPEFGKNGSGNVSVRSRFGRNRQYRLLYCRRCQTRFSERKGTPLFRAKTSEAKLLTLLTDLANGYGTRSAGRSAGVRRDTARRYKRLAGDRIRELSDMLLEKSDTPESVIKRYKQRLDADTRILFEVQESIYGRDYMYRLITGKRKEAAG
jgi:transposase-like protein